MLRDASLKLSKRKKTRKKNSDLDFLLSCYFGSDTADERKLGICQKIEQQLQSLLKKCKKKQDYRDLLTKAKMNDGLLWRFILQHNISLDSILQSISLLKLIKEIQRFNCDGIQKVEGEALHGQTALLHFFVRR